MNIFSREKNNTGRQIEVDLLRGFAATLLIIVHVGLYIGSDIGEGLWTFCDIIGSEPASCAFMVLMGICIIYTRNGNFDELFKRGIRLFVIGYILNFFRSILPLLILGNIDGWTSIEAFFVVDILPFAGLSLMLIALLKKLRFSNILIFAVSVIMVVIDQLIMLPDTISWNSELLTGIVNLFCPVTEWSCFPLLTWFIFPAFGMVYGDILIRSMNKDKLYAMILPISLCGTMYVYYQFYILYPDYTSYYFGNNFYYMGLKNVLLALLIVCFLLSFWHFAGKILPDSIKKGLSFLSENLNLYYIISWILVSILIHVQAIFDWKFGNWTTIGVMVIETLSCIWITRLWLNMKRKMKG